MRFMAQKLFEVCYKGKRVGESGYAVLTGACRELKNAPAGSVVVQVDGAGNEIKRYSAQDCERKLRPPVEINSQSGGHMDVSRVLSASCVLWHAPQSDSAGLPWGTRSDPESVAFPCRKAWKPHCGMPSFFSRG